MILSFLVRKVGVNRRWLNEQFSKSIMRKSHANVNCWRDIQVLTY